MALIAIEQRAQLATAAALILIAMAPWHHATRVISAPATGSIWDAGSNRSMRPATGRLTIEIPMAPAAVPNPFQSWEHPDMRPWPTGMVIRPLPSGDRNVLGQTEVPKTGLFDRMLSALLAPFRSVSA